MNTEATDDEGEQFLQSLPPQENQEYEFKCSSTPDSQLAEKIWKAASGFWNAGGGTLVIGVANDGRPDEGISLKVGWQPRKDWIDQVIWRVDPQGNHKVQIPRKNSDKGVFAIKFDQSHIGPHMAPDCRYYIRAGAHTVQANHFIVESIRARRSAFHPILRCGAG